MLCTKKPLFHLNLSRFWIFVCFTTLIILVLITFPMWYEPIIVDYLGIDTTEKNRFKWEVITGLGYTLGLGLVVWQISNSSRRADAAERTFIEQRYHNAVEHLSNESESIRIGAIYNLYHISRNMDEYDQTIFDMFCAYLKRKKTIQISKKEKQIVVDKLCRGEGKKRIISEPDSIDISSADLSGIDFSNADLRNAILKGANLDGCVFDGADLTKAELPAELNVIKSMKGAILDEIELYTGTDMEGLQLQASSLKNSRLLYVNLSNANLTDAIGLTFEQLSKVKCLYNVIGLGENLKNRLMKEKPELFEQLKT